VVIADIDEGMLEETLTALEARHAGNLKTVVCNVTQTANCRKAIKQTGEAFGRLDVLINAAGVIKKGPVEAVPKKTMICRSMLT
jgi:NADP-dependent 3-hydroxy acid dehydrogenase YdfG